MTQAPAVHGCPVDESFDPLSPGFLADPYAALAALPRDEQPIFFAPSIGYYVLTRYADIEQVVSDPVTYSAAGQRLTFHPNISFRGPQVLMVRAQ